MLIKKKATMWILSRVNGIGQRRAPALATIILPPDADVDTRRESASDLLTIYHLLLHGPSGAVDVTYRSKSEPKRPNMACPCPKPVLLARGTPVGACAVAEWQALAFPGPGDRCHASSSV